MRRFAIRLLMLAMFSAALVAAPGRHHGVRHAGQRCACPLPPPRPRPRRSPANSARAGEYAAFAKGYHAAYATIYDRHDYAAAIEQLKALGHDDTAAVANLIGYSYRKLGDYQLSQVWYERALKADPDHVKTWQYYGLWQLEQGNREQAEYHLSKIARSPAPTARNTARLPQHWRSRPAPASSTDFGEYRSKSDNRHGPSGLCRFCFVG